MGINLGCSTVKCGNATTFKIDYRQQLGHDTLIFLPEEQTAALRSTVRCGNPEDNVAVVANDAAYQTSVIQVCMVARTDPQKKYVVSRVNGLNGTSGRERRGRYWTMERCNLLMLLDGCSVPRNILL